MKMIRLYFMEVRYNITMDYPFEAVWNVNLVILQITVVQNVKMIWIVEKEIRDIKVIWLKFKGVWDIKVTG